MLKIVTSVCCAVFFSGACFAGANFKGECAHYTRAVYKENISITEFFALKISNDYYPVTVKIGDYHYSISRNNSKVYEVAKMAYFFGMKVDVCTRSGVRGNIDELLGINMTD